MPEPFSKDTTLFSSLTNTLLRGSERIRASCSCSVPNTHSSATLLLAKIPRPAEGGKPTRNTSCHRLLEPIQNGTKTPTMKKSRSFLNGNQKEKAEKVMPVKMGRQQRARLLSIKKFLYRPDGCRTTSSGNRTRERNALWTDCDAILSVSTHLNTSLTGKR